MKKAIILSFSVFLFFSMLVPSKGFCENRFLKEGIAQYREENFEEAVDVLIKARQQEPSSSTAAFFLGLTYKQVMNYPEALKNLRDAVQLTPRIKQALVELIDVLYRLGKPENLKEAHKWISVGENAGIYPAKIEFLKGLVLQKEDKNMDAIQSFEKAKKLQPSMTQSAEVQIALSYLKERDLKKAKDRLKTAVLFDPKSDLASFARRYQDLVEKRMELEKPLRVTVGLFGQYDSNVVLKPLDDSVAGGVTDEGSYGTTGSLKVDYLPVLKGPWLFNAQYSLSGVFYQKHATTHNNIINGIYLAPGYNFGKYAVNLAVNYNHVMVRNPGFEKYMDTYNAGPMIRFSFAPGHLAEVAVNYGQKEYKEGPLTPEEDRDSSIFTTYASWIWIFQKDSFFNVRYEYSNENADGTNWENEGHRISLNMAIPVYEKIKLQLSGQAFFQDYKNVHTTFNVKRNDDVYQGALGFTWEFFKNTNLIVQYTHIRANSNISIYDYRKDMYMGGVEYRF